MTLPTPAPIYARFSTASGSIYINPAAVFAVAATPQNPLAAVILSTGGGAVQIDGVTPATVADTLAAAVAVNAPTQPARIPLPPLDWKNS